jgi:hypothetical protein
VEAAVEGGVEGVYAEETVGEGAGWVAGAVAVVDWGAVARVVDGAVVGGAVVGDAEVEVDVLGSGVGEADVVVVGLEDAFDVDG